MNTFTQFLSGKRTYLVAIAAIAYLLLCQYTGQKPDETILGIFGALGLAALRAGIPANNAAANVAAAVNNGTGYPFPPQTPRSQVNGSNSNGVLPCLLVGGLCMVLGTGCFPGRDSGPGTLTRSHLQFERTKEAERLDLDSHKDVEVAEVERIAPDGSAVKIKGYKSRANDAALEASSRMFDSLAKMGTAMQESLNRGLKDLADKAERYMSARDVQGQREVIVVTNYVPATVVLTNAPISVPTSAVPAK